MKNVFLKFLLFTWFVSCQLCAATQEMYSIERDGLIICPDNQLFTSPPSFSEPECKQASFSDIDPQNNSIWVKAKLNVPEKTLSDSQPYAIYIFGKTSSRVYFNGVYLGQNGTPSQLAEDEYVGRMDVNFYIPSSLLKQTSNELVLHLSSHHGTLHLSSPIHYIGLGTFSLPLHMAWRNALLSFIPLGALILGALYFAVASFSPHKRRNNILFFMMALLASCQLFAEISRQITSYSYPFHDIRLIVITGLSMSFGICLWIYNINKFMSKNKFIWILVGLLLTLIAVIGLPGFDIKTAIAVLIPSFFSTLLIAFQAFKYRTKALWINSVIFLLFTLTIIITLERFHDTLFYYIITCILFFLFVQQARELNKEQAKRKAEEQQVAKLQFKLDQNTQKLVPHKLKVASAGKMELVSSDTITYCQAAGDYVDIYFEEQKHVLYSGNLKELEGQLPSTFLRVHRSYIVNADFITSLENPNSTTDKAGTWNGFLLLNGGEKVPVSRRIMPTVRSVFNQDTTAT